MNTPIAKSQAGVMLLEALIAILIFSLGILSLVALQSTSIQLTSDAKYRTDASLLANKLIGQMWASGLSTADLQAQFQTDCTDCTKYYDPWLAEIKGKDGLPGVAAGVASTLPTVTVDAAGQVVIILSWRTPQMDASKPGHSHVVVSQIARNTP